jgi:hypothetical protein
MFTSEEERNRRMVYNLRCSLNVIRIEGYNGEGGHIACIGQTEMHIKF